MGSKRIGTFKQFLKEQRQGKLNETLKVEVKWWDQAIVEVMQEIEDECQGFLVWETIINYCKSKWSILGRELPLPVSEDNLLLQHIKELIFTLHGKSLYTDWKCDVGWDNAQVHSKGLVIEELAAVILEKVREKLQTGDEPESGNLTGTLSDREEIKMVPMKPAPSYEDEYCEDLPFEHKRQRPVKGFEAFTKKLNETVAMIDCASQEDCINFCIDLVKKNVGSLDPVEILDVALQAASAEVKLEVVKNYFKHMIYDYLCNEKGQVKIVGIGDPKDVQENVPEEVFEQGLEILCGDIADTVIDRLAEENGFGYEKV